MDARAFVQWTFRAGVALLAIVVGFYLSPWLGGASLPLAVLLWVAILIGVLYAAEALPWIDRIDSISRLLRVYAPPLTEDEKERLRQLAEEREQVLLWEDTKQAEDVAEAQRAQQFLNKLPYESFNTSSREEPKPVEGTEPAKEDSQPAEPTQVLDNSSSEEPKPVQPTEPTKEEPKTLDELVGLASVKQKILEYKNLLEVSKRRGQDLRKALQPNFVMLGRPGTGKTTVAKIMGKIFYEFGYLATDKVVVVSNRAQLIGEYVGHTAVKTLEVLESALDGTLFIDEAYTLVPPETPNDFGHEAIATLLPFMEENRGRLVVIVAGYQNKMQGFFNSNEGLRSRFTNYIRFPDYTPEECTQIFKNMLAEQVATQPFTLTPEASDMLPALFSKLRDAPDWSNSRDVRTYLGDYVLIAQSNRLKGTGEGDDYSITSQDLESALDAFVQIKLLSATD